MVRLTTIILFFSALLLGQTIDNIAPSSPGNFSAFSLYDVEVELTWEANKENDFAYYAIYKGHSEIFDADSNSLLTTTIDTVFLDNEILDGSYYYKISAFDYSGNESEFSNSGEVFVGLTNQSKMPGHYILEQNYPNPFNPGTVIKYSIPEISNVRIEIFNMLGENIKILVDHEKSAGVYEQNWDAANLPSGIYMIGISADSRESNNHFNDVKKALLIK
ncbi:MAG: T9SS type A sorting domain-containing protein [Melioribacteraceae bacterium]|nr:T9SS type A sorting domain-containing protein [Melioribacteraceae bacterium]